MRLLLKVREMLWWRHVWKIVPYINYWNEIQLLLLLQDVEELPESLAKIEYHKLDPVPRKCWKKMFSVISLMSFNVWMSYM
jgi:hypothetical protein